MRDAAKKHEQATALRRLADRIEHDGSLLPDFLITLLSVPVGPPATEEELNALGRAKKTWAEERHKFMTLEEAKKWFEVREKR